MGPALLQQVRNGRLVLDEPTNLPEGEGVYLQPIDMAAVVDDLDDEERAALHQALDEGIVAARAGDHSDAEDLRKSSWLASEGPDLGSSAETS